MTIRMMRGDLLSSKASAYVNTVNCKGVMGAGIARQFAERFSEDYLRYYGEKCERREIVVGKPDLFKVKDPRPDEPQFIVSFPTKNHWKEDSDFRKIADGIDLLKALVASSDIPSIAVPALGCSNGRLDWASVCGEMYRRLSKIGAEVEFYAPLDANDFGCRLPRMVAEGDKPIGDFKPPRSLPDQAIRIAMLVGEYRSISNEWIAADQLKRIFRELVSPMEKSTYWPLIRVLTNNWVIEETPQIGPDFGKAYKVGRTHDDVKSVYSAVWRKHESSVLELLRTSTGRPKQLTFV
ncbi:MAG: macro domain-containing protein [Thermomicrobiales bacterium]